MKIKKSLRYYILLVILFTFNFSAKSYTRGDLENLQTGAAVADLALSLPFLLSENPSVESFWYPAPAIVAERVLSCALEDVSLVTIITALIKILKLSAHPEFSARVGRSDPGYLYVKSFLLFVAYQTIASMYPKKKDRIKRRKVRVIVESLLDAAFASIHNVGDSWNCSEDLAAQAKAFAGHFVKALVLNGVAEYVGEKIIHGAVDGD